jgi:hypothetical protein
MSSLLILLELLVTVTILGGLAAFVVVEQHRRAQHRAWGRLEEDAHHEDAEREFALLLRKQADVAAKARLEQRVQLEKERAERAARGEPEPAPPDYPGLRDALDRLSPMPHGFNPLGYMLGSATYGHVPSWHGGSHYPGSPSHVGYFNPLAPDMRPPKETP